MLDTGGHMAHIRDITFTADGKQLVSASDDKTIRVWDLATGKRRASFAAKARRAIRASLCHGAFVRWQMACGGGICRLSSPAQAREYRGGAQDPPLLISPVAALWRSLRVIRMSSSGLAFSPDGRRLISGSADSTAILWDVETRQGNAPSSSSTAISLSLAVAFTPDGARVVTGSDRPRSAALARADGGEIAPMRGHGDKVRAWPLLPDGMIASGDWSGEIRLWDGKTGAFRKTLARQPTEVGSLSFSRDGKQAAVGDSPRPAPTAIPMEPSLRCRQRAAKSSPIPATIMLLSQQQSARTNAGRRPAAAAINEIHLWDPLSGPGTTPRIGERRLGRGWPTLDAYRAGTAEYGPSALQRMVEASHGEMRGNSTIPRGGYGSAPADPRAALGGGRDATPAQSRSSGEPGGFLRAPCRGTAHGR